MQVRDFLAILAKRWAIVVVSLGLVVLSTAGFTLAIAPTYKATARIFLTATTGGNVISTDDLGTFVELLGSPVVQDPLRAALQLPAGTPLDLSGAVSGNTPILDITARSSSPTLARDLANAVGPVLATIGGKYAPLLAVSGQGVEATTITPASLPATPESPNVLMNLALGVLAGFGLGVGAALLRHFFDARVRGEVDLRSLSDRPLLGSLPNIKGVATNMLVVETDPHSHAAEEFRRLRTNLQFADVTTGGRHSFVVTSAAAGEGKTTTAVNLGLAMADSGARVLLVDADMRHPSVAEKMGLEGGVGLTTLLLGRATEEDVTQQWGETSLYVLPAGEIPPNPSELLGSEAIRRLFSGFLDAYDYVIVDSPPILPVVDPVLIGRLVGGMIMVVSVDQTLKREVTSALKQLQTVEMPLSGFALNRLPGGDTYGRYGYYRHSAKAKAMADSSSMDPGEVVSASEAARV